MTVGAGTDHTRAIYERTFTLVSAIGAEQLGGSSATGNKLTFEGDAAYSSVLGTHPYGLEGEVMFSDFSRSLTDVFGGYLQLQVTLFDTPGHGDFDPCLRYDFVHLEHEAAPRAAIQQALRAGINYNLPSAHTFASVHVEYALNQVSGPPDIIERPRTFGEVRIELRVRAVRFVRH